MIRCPACNTENPDIAKFCIECGERLGQPVGSRQTAQAQDGAAAQGDNNLAVGTRGIGVKGNVDGDVVTGEKKTEVRAGDVSGELAAIAVGNVTQVVVKAGGVVVMGEQPVEITAVDRQTSLGRYLEHVIAHNRYLQHQGIRSGGRLVNIELDQIYITLRATQQRTVHIEQAWLTEEAALAPGERQTPGLERTLSETVNVRIEQALKDHPHLVVLGDPGSGKTTLLRYLALLYARDLAQDARQVAELLQLSESGYLPVLLPLRQIGAFLRARKPSSDGTEGLGLLLEFLLEYLKNERVPLPGDFFDNYLNAGKAVVLLDGMDEVADPDLRKRVARLVESFTLHYPQCRFVVTSRIVGYSGPARLSGDYTATTVRDFTLANVRQFLSNWHRLLAVSQMGPGEDAEHYAENQTAELLQAIQDNERIRELAINPLLLTVLALVHRDRVKLPDRRAELYAETVDVLLGKWDEARGVKETSILEDRPFDTGDRRLLLQAIALYMHERQQKEIAAEDLRRLLSNRFAEILGGKGVRQAVERFQRAIEERSGLLTARGEGVYAFSHQTFQEYLAALAVAGRDDYVSYTVDQSGDAWWREVILLEVGHLSTQSKERTIRLVRAIAKKKREPEPFYNLTLAGECVRDVGYNRLDSGLIVYVQGRLRNEFESRGISRLLPFQKNRRIAAAKALVRIFSREIAHWTQPYGEPEWVNIPAGEFWMGSSPEQVQRVTGFDQFVKTEQPQHKLNLPFFQISRVPITNAQYALFIKATGYSAPRNWEDNHPPMGKEMHPVVFVDWDDAQAYCIWLSKVTRKVISLPSEAEWEKAARGSIDKRSYPWGDFFEATRCNTREIRLGDTSPVGIFQEGASPSGCLDMSGNVLEWTRSLWSHSISMLPTYPYPYQALDGREDLDRFSSGIHVLRGGYFANHGSLARVSSRLLGHGKILFGSEDKNRYIGFRVVIASQEALSHPRTQLTSSPSFSGVRENRRSRTTIPRRSNNP